VIAAAMLLAACGGRGLKGDGGKPIDAADASAPLPAIRDVDVVFVIDNSSGAYRIQPRIINAFPAFAQALAGLPGGLPNLHLGIVSSDLGAGPYSENDISFCRTGGDRGAFHAEPLGTTCAEAALNAGARFVSNVDGVANYTGRIEDVFACIAALGSEGCSFEHPFASLLRALGADGAAPPTAGFLRPDAALVVVFVTDEDDCSAPPDSVIFDPTSRYVSDPLGPLTSYRCNELGHLCGGKAPPRTGMADLSGTCRSAEDGKLLKVSDVAARLKALKGGDDRRIIVAAIAGPPDHYVVRPTTPTLQDDPSQWPEVAPLLSNEYLCVPGGPHRGARLHLRRQRRLS
jgi:hypothetical protein